MDGSTRPRYDEGDLIRTGPRMKIADVDQGKLLSLLEEVARSVEELLLSGLTTASESTRRLLEVSFQETSRMRLLRLGATLRLAGEELGRFTRDKEGFSARRLCFFLNRAWLLCQGLARALRNRDDEAFAQLLRTPAGQLVESIDVVALGVARKLTPGGIWTFDFRLRTLNQAGPVPAGGRVNWSCAFPQPPGHNISPEGFLLTTQKQGFKAQVFTEGKVVALGGATVTPDSSGGGRITLGEKSTVSAGAAFTDWQRFASWRPEAALERLRKHQPGPLDLEVELQEEVVLRQWRVGPGVEEEGQRAYPIAAGAVICHAVVNPGEEGKPLRQALEAMQKKDGLPPLFGLMHYERCRLVLQPLAVLGPNGPELLTLSKEKVDLKGLLQSIKW
jgi:hypothetical protein